MDSCSGSLASHPVVQCVAGMGAALDEVEGIDPAYMSVPEKESALLGLRREIERAQGLKLALMANCEDVATESGDRDIASWLAPRVQADHGPTKAQLKVAEAIDQRWHRVGAALRGGGCSYEQARVIVKALDELPREEVGNELLAKAEAHLIAQAAHFTPKELKRLGDKILEVIAPDTYDDQERKNLQDQQRRASAATRLNFRNRGDGATDINARVPDSVAARLKAYLDAFTQPRKANGTSTDPPTASRGGCRDYGCRADHRPGHRATHPRRPPDGPRLLRPP